MLTQFANSYIICENVQRVVARENRIQGIYVTVYCIVYTPSTANKYLHLESHYGRYNHVLTCQ